MADLAGVGDLGFDLSALIREHNLRIFTKDTCIIEIINTVLEHDTTEEPFFIVDLGKVIRQYRRWVELMPDIQPFYAIKCNNNPLVLKVLGGLGCNFDCASRNEIAAVIATSVDPDRIVFANPTKMTSQIKYARGNDIDLMSFDSDNELYKIKLYHPYSALLLRIRVNDEGSLCRFGCKFGVATQDAGALLAIAAALKLNVVGVSFHIGSGCSNVDRFAEAIRDARSVFRTAAEHGFELSMLDIGGGFPGVDVDAGPPAPDTSSFEAIAGVVNATVASEFADVAGLRVIAEPGRYMVASTHTLVVNIISKKERVGDDGQKEFVYYLNDGIYGSFNCIFFDHQKPVICPFNERDGQLYRSKIFGPTCDSIDMIIEQTMLPELAIGEWCYVQQFGAYTASASTSFNGFANAGTVYVMTC